MNLEIKKEFPLVLLITSSFFFAQHKAKQQLMKRQAKIMGQDGYMSEFQEQHRNAFESPLDTQVTTEAGDLKVNGLGLPLEGQYGLYSSKLNYKEWYRIACARKAYDEIAEENPKMTFQVVTGGLLYPWLSIGLGSVYFLTTVKRTYLLFKDNGL